MGVKTISSKSKIDIFRLLLFIVVLFIWLFLIRSLYLVGISPSRRLNDGIGSKGVLKLAVTNPLREHRCYIAEAVRLGL